MTDDGRTITAKVPQALAVRLDEIALRIDRSRSWIVRQALAEWLAEEQRRYELTLEALDDVDAGRVIPTKHYSHEPGDSHWINNSWSPAPCRLHQPGGKPRADRLTSVHRLREMPISPVSKTFGTRYQDARECLLDFWPCILDERHRSRSNYASG